MTGNDVIQSDVTCVSCHVRRVSACATIALFAPDCDVTSGVDAKMLRQRKKC